MDYVEFSNLVIVLLSVIVVCALVSAIQLVMLRKSGGKQESAKACSMEAEIALLGGDKAGALKWYYRALYLDYAKDNTNASPYYFEKLKRELFEKYNDKIASLGGLYPESCMPVDKRKEALESLQLLFDSGQYTQAEYEAEKADI
ncbi:MAG TPA: hypothetical protein PLZ52_12205, partial [Bacteroidales bacterium]|nr:hypothetical protein [Bacteroidales bacterium]